MFADFFIVFEDKMKTNSTQMTQIGEIYADNTKKICVLSASSACLKNKQNGKIQTPRTNR